MHLLHNEYNGSLVWVPVDDSPVCASAYFSSFYREISESLVSLINTNSRNVEQALQEHNIDLGMVGVFRLPNLKYEPFLHDELVPVVCTSSALAKKIR